MKILLASLALFGLSTCALDKTSSLEALRILEQKLQTNIKGKLDETGANQLKNLLQITAFSHLTQLASKTPEQLSKYQKQIDVFRKPDINKQIYNTQLSKIEQQIKKNSEKQQQVKTL